MNVLAIGTKMAQYGFIQILISMMILVASTVGIGFVAAKVYRVGVLLYGMPPKMSTILKTVFKKK